MTFRRHQSAVFTVTHGIASNRVGAMPAMRRPSVARFSAVAIASLLAIVGLSSCAAEPEGSPTIAPTPTAPEPPQPVAPEEPDDKEAATGFDRGAHSLEDPDSIWVITNKLRPLDPQTYTPDDLVSPNVVNTNGQPLRSVAALATERMVAAAAADGVEVHVVSAFRSYDMQVKVYGNFVANQGEAYADTTSGTPSIRRGSPQTLLATMPARSTLVSQRPMRESGFKSMLLSSVSRCATPTATRA